jgi:hypothetical protein
LQKKIPVFIQVSFFLFFYYIVERYAIRKKITEATNRQISSPTLVRRSASVIDESIAHLTKNSNNPDEILKIPLGYLCKNKNNGSD